MPDAITLVTTAPSAEDRFNETYLAASLGDDANTVEFQERNAPPVIIRKAPQVPTTSHLMPACPL